MRTPMMEANAVFVVLAFVVLIALAWLWQTLVSKARRSVTRAVFKGKHNAGQGEVKAIDEYHVPAAEGEVRNEIIARVNAHEQAPALAAGLYLKQRNANAVTFAYGNKLSDGFTAEVDTQWDGTSTRVTYEVKAWTESDGLVTNQDQIRRLRGRVRDAVAALGGTAVERP